MRPETIEVIRPQSKKGDAPFVVSYAAGMFSLSFNSNGHLEIILVRSDKNMESMLGKDFGLPFGKEEETDKVNVLKTIRREFAEETHSYPRIPLTFAFTLERANDNDRTKTFPNYFHYGWDDGKIEITDEVVFNPPSKNEEENQKDNKAKIVIQTKERISEVKKFRFLSAINANLRPQQRMAIIELYHMLREGSVVGHEDEVKQYFEKNKFELPIFEAFERPTETQKRKGLRYFEDRNFLTLVVKSGCNYVFEPSSPFCCDFLYPKSSLQVDTDKLVFFEYEGQRITPKDQIKLAGY